MDGEAAFRVALEGGIAAYAARKKRDSAAASARLRCLRTEVREGYLECTCELC